MEFERDRLLKIYRERVAAYAEVDSGFAGRWGTWCQTVLTHGGVLVVPPMDPEPDLDELLGSAEPHGPEVTFLDLGGDCHANVASLWVRGDIDVIGTGYALTEDLWRQHSWGLTGDGTVMESKHVAERYVGIRLATGEPTVKFAVTNYPDDIRVVLKSGTDRANEILQVIRDVQARAAQGHRGQLPVRPVEPSPDAAPERTAKRPSVRNAWSAVPRLFSRRSS